LLQESQNVALTGGRIDVVVSHNGVSNRPKRSGLLDETPDLRTELIKAVVRARREVEDDDLAPHVAGDLIGGSFKKSGSHVHGASR
jgi:hypothetical protein